MLAAVRAASPLVVYLALVAAPSAGSRSRIAALLTAQIAFGFATLALAAGRRPAVARATAWAAIVADLAVATGLVWETGGLGGPLVFLFGLEALAVGLLLSAGAGLRVLGIAIVLAASVDVLRPAMDAAAAGSVLALSALGLALAAVTQRESRRRALELATIRRIALDIQESLSLEEILADLCRGVVNDLRFSTAAVLIPGLEGWLSCAGACGLRGRRDRPIPVRGGVAQALSAGRIMVVPKKEAQASSELVPLLGPRGYIAFPMGSEGLLVVTRVPSGRMALRRRSGRVRAHELEPLASLAQQAALAVANARLHAHVSAMAVTDPLTELPNHGEFQRILARECERLRRYRSPRAPGQRLSLLLIDIDRFKSVNDRFGHQVGDHVLRAVGRSIRGSLRSFDLVARYGGEEFAVVLPETDDFGALQVAERARSAVASVVHDIGDRRVRVTISVGAATAPDDAATPAQLVAAADAALYRSKATGRDRVTHASLGGKVRSIGRRKVARSA